MKMLMKMLTSKMLKITNLNFAREMMLYRKFIFLKDDKEYEIWETDNGNGNKRVMLFKTLSDTIQIKTINDYRKKMKDQNINHAIIIYQKSISSCVKIGNENCKDYTIELLNVNNIKCNVLKHVYQPNIRKCTPLQSQKILEKYKYAMPQILSDDPICIWGGFVEKDILAFCSNKEKCSFEPDENGICIDCKDTSFRIVCNISCC